MQTFIDRVNELSALQREYDRQGSSLVIIYGRRRVGKTSLISEFIKNKRALFFLASEESEMQNLRMFKDKTAEFTGNELLKHSDISNWDIIFKTIVDSKNESKPIIVIDEFQYIGKSNPAFPSIFQRVWDQILKNSSVMVILCGSLISMMESQTLSYSSPLYGRRTAQIKLGQIAFEYYKNFFNNKEPKELIKLYSVTGGVPKYIEMFSDGTDVFDSIDESILNKSSYLYDEPYFLLQQEVSEIGSYFSLIRAIAAGNNKLSAISSSLEVKATSLSKYLKVLTDLDIIEREVPVTEEKPLTSKRGLYKIKDNYIKFWFTFIYPNMSYIESGNTKIVSDIIRNNLISRHTAYVFEDICKERMWKLNAEKNWPFYFKAVGKWWNSKEEIDIAALDQEGNNLILGECKYKNEPVDISVFNKLEFKSRFVEWRNDNRSTWYVLFSVSGFTEDLTNLAAARKDLLLVDF